MGLDKLGITGPSTVYRNLTYQELFDHEVANKEGVVAKAEYGDTFTVDTGKYTGRSPKDRFIVLNPGSETAENMDWNDINQPTTPEVFHELYDKAVKYFNTRETAYVFDGYCGANKATQKKIRFVHEMSWQQHFGESVLCFLYCVCSRHQTKNLTHPASLFLIGSEPQSPTCSFVPKHPRNWRDLNPISP